MADQEGQITHQGFFNLAKIKEQLQWDLVRQLEKDLSITIDDISPEFIFDKVKTAVVESIENGNLPLLLYRIDVKESAVTGNTDQLCLEIIRREARKVLFRSQYGRDHC